MNRTRGDAERRRRHIQRLIESGCPQYQPAGGELRVVQLVPESANMASPEPEKMAPMEDLRAREYQPPGPNFEQRIAGVVENRPLFPLMYPLVVAASITRTMFRNLGLMSR